MDNTFALNGLDFSPEINMARYLQSIRKFPILEQDEEFELATRYKETKDEKIAYKLVTSHLRLVVKVVSKYRGYGLPLGEMISEGNIGLLMRSTNLSRPRGFVFPPMLYGGLRPRYRNIFSIRGRWSKSVQRPRRKNSFSICAKSRTSLI